MRKDTRPLSRSHTPQGREKTENTRQENKGRRELGGGRAGKGVDEAGTESAVLNCEDNAITFSLGVSAEDLTVNRV